MRYSMQCDIEIKSDFELKKMLAPCGLSTRSIEEEMMWPHNLHDTNTAKSRYNAVQFFTKLHTALQLKWHKVDQIIESQQTHHTSRRGMGCLLCGMSNKLTVL